MKKILSGLMLSMVTTVSVAQADYPNRTLRSQGVGRNGG